MSEPAPLTEREVVAREAYTALRVELVHAREEIAALVVRTTAAETAIRQHDKPNLILIGMVFSAFLAIVPLG